MVTRKFIRYHQIKDHTETRDSSRIKIALSKNFPRVKMKHTRKTADGRIIEETDIQETASHVMTNWPKNVFGNSDCREPKTTNLI